MTSKDDWPREKRWKDMYTRGEKLARAKQLGFEYPVITERQLVQAQESERKQDMNTSASQRTKILFVCSRNQWRSPTGEQVWRRHPRVEVRSGGTSPNARHVVSVDDVRWADVIFVMEEKHKSRLLAEFTRLLENKRIVVLDIPDEYKYMDPELVELLEQSVASALGLNQQDD